MLCRVVEVFKKNPLMLTFLIFCLIFITVLTVVQARNHSKVICTQDIISDAEMLRKSTEFAEGEGKIAYFTFDDGPSRNTDDVLDVLKEFGIKATFFVVTSEEHEDYFPLLTRIEKEGHVVALHSHSHSYKEIYSGTDRFWEDLDAQREVLLQYIDEIPHLFRFPGGSTNTVSRKYGGSTIMEQLKEEAEQKGYTFVDWNVSAEDAGGSRLSSSSIANNVIKGAMEKDEAIILMHDAHDNNNTVLALPQIIRGLQAQGFLFDTIPLETLQAETQSPAED